MVPGPDDQRGAAAVEFALLVPLFFTLVMGTISGGLAFDRNNMVIHATREAVRYAATLPIAGTTGVPNAWFDDVATVTLGSSAGRLDTDIAGMGLCVAYIGFAPAQSSTSDWTRVRRQTGPTVTYSSGSVTNPSSWCFNDGRGTSGAERRVQVVAQRETEFYVFVFNSTVTLSSDAVSRFEPVT